jgi:hypothetical protein
MFCPEAITMKLLEQAGVGLLLLAAAPLWAQVDTTPAAPVPAVVGPAMGSEDSGSASGNQPASDQLASNSDRMMTPPPVSGQSYPSAPASEERSNYLRGGMEFTTAYTDNALGSVTGHPVSDVSYSLAPFVELDETTPRLHVLTRYAPGFTFYQRTSSRNEEDQNAAIDLQYRLSPHLTLSARDGFQKSSNVFNQPDLAAAGAVSGGTGETNFSIISPIADRLSNTGNAGISWQFAANELVGAGGTFTNLHYPDQAEVPGLFDASSQAGSAFYAVRPAQAHYLGVTYQYQRLLSYPAEGLNETQTQAVLFFYSFFPSTRLSFSFFGGPQYADAGPQYLGTGPAQGGVAPVPASRSWNPAAGASFNWQGHLTSFALSYSHLITSGGGLLGAVLTDSASASLKQQIVRTLSASLAAGYAQNDLLSSALLLNDNGHTLSGTAVLQQQFREHLEVQLGYTRLHQSYGGVAVLAATPDTNREFVALSYRFSRGLGR